MENYKKIVGDLQKFGLSPNEASIYLSLINKKELRIQQITTLTGIPRSSVYESLKVLSSLGLIEQIIDHKFLRIRPYPLTSIKHQLREKLGNLESQILQLDNLEELIGIFQNQVSDTTTIKYFKGVSGARQLFWNTLNTKSVVNVYSAFGRSKFVGKKFYMDFVAESKQRLIKEKVLINPTDRALTLIKADTGTALARTKTKDIKVLPIDTLSIEGETFIYDNTYAQIRLDGQQINGFEIQSEYFVNMQRSIFNILWSLSKPITDYL